MRRGTMQVQILPRVQKNISDRISANLCSNAVAFECGAARSHPWHNVRQIRRLGLRISLPSSSAILRTQLLHAWCACVPRGIRTRPHFSICNQNGYSSFAVACLPHLIAQRASEDIDGGVLTIRRHRLFQIICASVCVCVCVCVRVCACPNQI